LSGRTQLTHREQISGSNGANLIRSESEYGLRVAGRGNEFNLNRLRTVDLNHGTNVPTPYSVSRKISDYNNSVENLEWHGLLLRIRCHDTSVAAAWCHQIALDFKLLTLVQDLEAVSFSCQPES